MPYQHTGRHRPDRRMPSGCRSRAVARQHLQCQTGLVHIIEPMAMAFGGDVPMDLSMLQQQQFDQARERMNGFADSYPGSLRKIATWLTGSLARKCIG